LKTLIEKERAYKAEVEYTKQQHINSISGWDNEEVRSKVHTELTALVEGLEEHKSELKFAIEKADNELAKEKQKLEEHNKINALLRQKLETQELIEAPETLHTVTQALEEVTRKLKWFLDTRYPPPHDESQDSGSKKRKKNEVGSFQASNGKSLLKLLGDVTSKYATAPQSPYVDVAGYWRPYVDLLVMAGIAEYDYKDSTLLRLVDFD